MKNILFVASEGVPFIKTGGLADVVGSLPKCIDREYFDVRVILPKYTCMTQKMKDKLTYKTHFYMDFHWKEEYVGIMESEVDGIKYYFIDNESYFNGFRPYSDNALFEIEKYAFFCKAALSILPVVGFRPDLGIKEEDFSYPEPTDTTKTIRDIIEKKPVSAKYYLSTTYLECLEKHKARNEAKGNGFGYEIKDLDGISNTIVRGGMGRERNLIVDKRLKDFTPVTHIKGEVNREGIRRMTPREWARLQGFPDTFNLPLADVHLYKQFGNSVTVNVIEAIAKQIKEVLDNA